jgi:predicted nucleic-acid-binding protein
VKTQGGQLIKGSTPVLITDVVLVETLWTLKGKKYRLNKKAIIDVLNSLFEEPNICFEDGQTVWRALNDYRHAKPANDAGLGELSGRPKERHQSIAA